VSENEMTQTQIEELLNNIIALLPEYLDTVNNYNDTASRSKLSVPDILLNREAHRAWLSKLEELRSLFAIFCDLIPQGKTVVYNGHSFGWAGEALYDRFFVAIRQDYAYSEAYADKDGFTQAKCYNDGSYLIRFRQ